MVEYSYRVYDFSVAMIVFHCDYFSDHVIDNFRAYVFHCPKTRRLIFEPHYFSDWAELLSCVTHTRTNARVFELYYDQESTEM